MANCILYKVISDKRYYYSFNIQDEFVLVEHREQAAKLTLKQAEFIGMNLGYYIEKYEQMD